MNNSVRSFPILLSLVVLAGATLFIVRHSTLRQLNSERSRIGQELAEWSNGHTAKVQARATPSASMNAGLSAAEHSELMRLRGEIERLRHDLAQETNQPARLAGTEAGRAADGMPQGQADVTAVVQALVASGTNAIVGNYLLGNDPAFGVVKRLRVEYNLGGELHTFETTEGGTLELPAGAEVVGAIYGDFPALDPSQEVMDVTKQIAAMVANGETSVTAANALVGLDPAPMIGKVLRVEMLVGGAPFTVEANEGQTLDIPVGAQVVQAVYGNLSGEKRFAPGPE
jgi:hypothetical protein